MAQENGTIDITMTISKASNLEKIKEKFCKIKLKLALDESYINTKLFSTVYGNDKIELAIKTTQPVEDTSEKLAEIIKIINDNFSEDRSTNLTTIWGNFSSSVPTSSIDYTNSIYEDREANLLHQIKQNAELGDGLTYFDSNNKLNMGTITSICDLGLKVSTSDSLIKWENVMGITYKRGKTKSD